MRKYNVLKVDSLQDCFLVIANTCENPITICYAMEMFRLLKMGMLYLTLL